MNKKYLLIVPVVVLPLLWLAVELRAAATFTPDSQPIGYLGQPGVTDNDLLVALPHLPSPNTRQLLFEGGFRSSDWSGALKAIPLDTNGTPDQGNERWGGGGAGTVLNGQNFDTGRKIFTNNGTQGVAFRYVASPVASSMTAAQQTSIGTATTAPKIINYVRGSHTDEVPAATGFRAREDVLGPIVHSSPRYFDDLTDEVVYVGANDGMLHAFDADTGTELWGYIPRTVIARLNLLTAVPFTNFVHYVDGGIAIARNVSIGGSPHTVLVGTLGAGGKGVFALKITDQTPASETAAAAMSVWEIDSATTGYANLGYTYGTPRFAFMNNSSTVRALVFGNGYMPGGNGHATLLVANAATGALIKEVDTGSGSAGAPNGLSSVRLLDTDSDGDTDYAYAGDLDGQLWKFDLTSATTSSWTATLLFTTSPVQAITSTPAVQSHPDGGYMVVFATGRALVAADMTSTARGVAYGIWDRPAGVSPLNDTLLAQTLTPTTYVNGAISLAVRIATANVPDWTNLAGHHKGWRTELPVDGERVLGEGTYLESGRFTFASTNPLPVNADLPNGTNWQNQLYYLTGGSPPSLIYNLNGDTEVDVDDRITSGGTPILTNLGLPVSRTLRYFNGTELHDGGLVSQPVLVHVVAALDDTLNTFNPNTALADIVPTDPGVSGGHFDVDRHNGTWTTSSTTVNTLTPATNQTSAVTCATTNQVIANVCVKTTTIPASGTVGSAAVCTVGQGFAATHNVYVSTVTGATCGGGKNLQTLTCRNSAGLLATDIPAVGTTNSTKVCLTAAPQSFAVGKQYFVSAAQGASCGASRFAYSLVCGAFTSATVTASVQTANSLASKTHTHEYDDIYDVTGVNFLDANNPAEDFNNTLVSVDASANRNTIPFKVLAFNQYFSPAVRFTIGGNAYVTMKDYGGLTSAGFDITTLPTYCVTAVPGVCTAVTTMGDNMPVDAFTPKDWWGEVASPLPSGKAYVVRPGLIPTQTGCVKKTYPGTLGLLGEPYAGALTWQIVKSNTPQSAIQLNVAGRQDLGWRVRDTEIANYVLGEYTTFWHQAAMGACYGAAGWNGNPGIDPGAGSATLPGPYLGTDPVDGDFGAGVGGGSTTVTVVGAVTTIVTTFDDGSTRTEVRTENDDGSITVVVTECNAAAVCTAPVTTIVPAEGSITGLGGTRSPADQARLSWRELPGL